MSLSSCVAYGLVFWLGGDRFLIFEWQLRLLLGMKIIHVYKTDCFQASRVLLQTSWVAVDTIFLHRCLREGEVEVGEGRRVTSKRLGFSALARLAFELRGQDVRWVFHAQSSLFYLYALFLFSFFDRGIASLIAYDIHDLNERPAAGGASSIRSFVRYWILAAAEWGVARMKRVRTVTVSNGLARVFSGRTGGRVPVVVRSAPLPTLAETELRGALRFEKALLFFGTPQRVPFELVSSIAKAGYELHLYGRGIDSRLVDLSLPESLRSSVKLFGPYRPTDLDFIGKYKFVVLYKPDIVLDNFRYSLPNKFFQGLAYGTGFVVSENFEEVREIIEEIPGLGVVVRRGEESRLGELLQAGERGELFYSRVHSLAQDLSVRARRAYEEVIELPRL